MSDALEPPFYLPTEWRDIAKALYEAIGLIEDQTPGGGLRWGEDVQHAIDAYEYATDRESSDDS